MRIKAVDQSAGPIRFEAQGCDRAPPCPVAILVTIDDFVGSIYRYLCYLPLAHIMELAVEIALLASGFTLGYGGVGTLLPTSVKMLHDKQKGDAQALKPDIFVAAPAVCAAGCLEARLVRRVAEDLPGAIRVPRSEEHTSELQSP